MNLSLADNWESGIASSPCAGVVGAAVDSWDTAADEKRLVAALASVGITDPRAVGRIDDLVTEIVASAVTRGALVAHAFTRTAEAHLGPNEWVTRAKRYLEMAAA